MQKGDQTDSVITSLNQITRLPGTDDNLTDRKTKSASASKNKENLTDQTNSNSDNSITASKRPKSRISYFYFQNYFEKTIEKSFLKIQH